jgi:hypothetical protein
MAKEGGSILSAADSYLSTMINIIPVLIILTEN